MGAGHGSGTWDSVRPSDERGPAAQCQSLPVARLLASTSRQTFCDMDLNQSQSPAQTVDFLMDALAADARKVDSDLLANVIGKLGEQQAPAEVIVSMPVLVRVQQSPQRVVSWLKYEIFLTKVLVAGIMTPEQFESAVLPLLKLQMDGNLQAKFGSCLKGGDRLLQENEMQLPGGSVRPASGMDRLDLQSSS